MPAPDRFFRPGMVVLVTGSSSGIGAAVARHLGRHGCRLVLFARRAAELEAVARDVEAAGGSALVVPGDATSLEQVRAAHERIVRDAGPVEVAFLNAGIGDVTTITRFSAEQIRRLFDINVMGQVNWLDVLLPAMVARRGGTIIGTSSLARDRGLPSSGAYSASKAAVSVLLEALRVEGQAYGVRVVTFEPGFVKTPLTAKHKFKMPFLVEADDAAARLCQAVAAGRRVVRFPLPMSIASRFGGLLPPVIGDRVFAQVNRRTGSKARAAGSATAPREKGEG
jgi:NAD(P)-dependent dehydrogenase (short-subunit alcohol dehydrogenase family)